nr:hypothetical protein [Tanacetum cinerariifolium]
MLSPPLPLSPPPLPSSLTYLLGYQDKRLCIGLGLRFKVGDSSSAPTARPTGGFREDYGFLGTLDDEIKDRRAHARTARLMESEARLSREAWVQSMDASDTARAKALRMRWQHVTLTEAKMAKTAMTLERVKNLHALSVERKDISRGSVQS